MEFRPLNSDEKAIIKRELRQKKEMSYDNIRKLLKKYYENGKYGMFSHETVDTNLQGNKTNAIMANKEIVGQDWYDLSEDDKYDIIEELFSDKSNDELSAIYTKKYNLTEKQINGIFNKAIYKLDSGYIRYGKTAVKKLNNIMDNDNLDLHYAREKAGYGDENPKEASNRLEYYGKVFPDSVVDPQIDNPKNEEEKYGKIANPTIHVALNQLRKVVNELIDFYGKPEQIVIELARDLKNSRKAKEKSKNEIARNKKLNEEVDRIIYEYSTEYHTQIPNNKSNRDKVKLWLELGRSEIDRRCIYTGEQISIAKLFSDDVQIEHIVPYSKTLDDSMNNKTLSMKKANYYKGNKTPYEAFKDSKDGYDYDAIIARAKLLNNTNKFKRFTKDAMELYKTKEGGDFIARQLSDTQYLSKLACNYLQSLYDEKYRSSIWTIPGQLTALIRKKLGLNKLISDDDNKNRNDHRHHAIDAFVVTITTRSLLQKMAHAASVREDLDNRNLSSYRNKLFDKMPEPFHNYRKSIQLSIENIKTSHKADRSISGKLHEDTAYGLVKDNDKYNLVRRQEITDVINPELIRDKELREFAKNREQFNKIIKERNIQHIRTFKKSSPIIEIKDNKNNIFKAFIPGNNICAEIYEISNGKKYVEVITLLMRHRKVLSQNGRKNIQLLNL